MEIAVELIKELTKDERVMWVVGGGPVVSENTSQGIKEPELSGGYLTVEADNWHFHVPVDKVTGIQFVEAESHGDLSVLLRPFFRRRRSHAPSWLLPQPLLGR